MENFGPTIRGMEASIKRRINSMIAIIRDIEKHQTMPTKSMLQLLFEHSPQKKPEQAPLLIGSHEADPEMDVFYKKVDQALVLERENTNLKRDLRQNRAELKAVLNKVQVVKSRFAKPRLQLDMVPEDFEKLKMRLEKELH